MLAVVALSLPAPHLRAAGATRQPVGDAAVVRELKRIAQPLTGGARDYDRLLAAIGDARVVLLGEDTHGTSEHYSERARITKRLIAERGFGAVVIEGDPIPAAIVDAALRTDGSAYRIDFALRAFDRFPLWMWRNDEFGDLLRWIRAYNVERRDRAPVVLAGMDVYDLARPAAAVVHYLEGRDEQLAARAQARYDCFAPIDMDPQRYGEILSDPARGDCSSAVTSMLADLATKGAPVPASMAVDPAEPARDYFAALQSARALVAAEAYFRALYAEPARSWNIRDAHMASYVTLLLAELEARGNAKSPPGVVVWAHNAHIGDGRATNRAEGGDWTLGQLLRERLPGRVFSIGLITSRGNVHAATEWGEPGTQKTLSPPIAGSHAALLRRVGRSGFYAIWADSAAVALALSEPRPQRGIGVRYLPALERQGHYYPARLSAQFDAVVYSDRSTALHPRITE
jgi:erythromycin esterase-like protein